MTIKEYIQSQDKSSQTDKSKEWQELIEEIKSSELNKEDLIKAHLDFLSTMGEIYDLGFNHAIEAMEKVDSRFLSNKTPPHLQ